MALVRVEADPKQELMPKQREMLKKAAEKPIVYDDDLPEFSKEELAGFYRVAEKKYYGTMGNW